MTSTGGMQTEMSNAAAERRWLAPILEIGVSCGTALAYFASCYLIKVNSLTRMGQVSALSALAYRFFWFALPLIVVLILVAKHRPARWNLAVRLVCAAFAGLVSAVIAGGVLAMLHGTPYGLAGETGDSAILAKWAKELQNGEFETGLYPPLQIYIIAWISKIQDVPTIHAIKYFQLLGILAFGPSVYAAWRLLLKPTWALGMGVVVALPLLEAYRQYPLLVLAVFLPFAIKFLDTLRSSPEQPVRSLAIQGACFGLGFALLFLTYSGWFQWSAPGFLVSLLVVFPWRTARRHGAALCTPALIVFLAITGYYLYCVLSAPPLHDDFYYFDAKTEPMYIAMWKGGLPGPIAQFWPPVGEFGGVGLFTVLLCAGWASSLILGARQTAVMTTSWIMVGAWLLRMSYARKMAQTKLVQLYPRTTAELLYCLVVLCGLAVYLYVERRRETERESSVLRSPWSFIGALCGMSLLFMSVASAVTDRYMPNKIPDDYGNLAYRAVTTVDDGRNKTWGATAAASSTSGGRLVPAHLVDQDPKTEYESALSGTPDHEEWITVQLARIGRLSRIVLVPSPEGGFPVDFTIEMWDSQQWLVRRTYHDYQPTPGPQNFTWGQEENTGTVRVRVTKLGKIGDQYGLRLGEFEIYSMAAK